MVWVNNPWSKNLHDMYTCWTNPWPHSRGKWRQIFLPWILMGMFCWASRTVIINSSPACQSTISWCFFSLWLCNWTTKTAVYIGPVTVLLKMQLSYRWWLLLGEGWTQGIWQRKKRAGFDVEGAMLLYKGWNITSWLFRKYCIPSQPLNNWNYFCSPMQK